MAQINVADPAQVKNAEKKILSQRDQELNDLKSVLNLPYGRRFIWRLLSTCKTFASVWHPSALIHYQAGQQDIGHFLMSEIAEADQELLFLMMKENQKKRGNE